MKKLGLIGGIGPESTVSYYRDVVHGVQVKHGMEILPQIAIESLSAFQVFKFCRERHFDGLAEYILKGLRNLAAAGAEIAALTGNTPNIVFNQLKAQSPIALVSSMDACRDEALHRKLHSVGLLGTMFTMSNDFFRTPFEKAGLRVAVPNEAEIRFIQEKIEAELEHGIVKDNTRSEFNAIIRRMEKDEGIEQVILGCTELPLLLDDSTSPLPCLDTVSIHVDAILKAMEKD